MKTERKAKPVVLMIGLLAPPVGGMATSLKNLMNSDLKNKYTISVLDITGYRSRKGGNLLQGLAYQIYLIYRLMYILIEKRPRIVHVHLTCFLYFYRRAIDMAICKLLGRKIVVHLRGSRFKEFYNEGSPVTKFIIRNTLNLSDRIITLSQGWRDFFITMANPAKVVVIPNGVNCKDFYLEKNMKIALGFSREKILVLFMGPVSRRKGAFDLLDSVSKVTGKVKDVVFILCGVGEFLSDVDKLISMIKEGGLQDRVYYAGTLEGQDKINYYLSSDIFILPSYAENLPNSVLEAMAAGLPIIASDVGAIPEVIEDRISGFIIKPGDIDSMAERIITLAQDPALRQSMGKRNLELAKQKYDMPIVTEKIDMIYRDLLPTGRNRG